MNGDKKIFYNKKISPESLSRDDKPYHMPSRIEKDNRLLAFNSWEEYLDEVIEAKDIKYLGYVDTARQCVALGLRANVKVISDKSFYERTNRIANFKHELLHPNERELLLYSEGLKLDDVDELTKALAAREALNVQGYFQSIIFIRYRTNRGNEVSGYIDYAHRLLDLGKKDFWIKFFHHEKLLLPKLNDLGYYHWQNRTVKSTTSKNYEPLMSVKGLLFQNRHDHKIIHTNPKYPPGTNTEKFRIRSKLYSQVEIYDHEVRKRTM